MFLPQASNPNYRQRNLFVKRHNFLQICGNSCRDLATVATKHNIAQSPNPTNRYTKTTEFKNNKHTYTKKALLIKTLLPRIFRTKRIMNTKSYGLESNFSIPSSYPSGQSSIPDFSGLSRDSCQWFWSPSSWRQQ